MKKEPEYQAMKKVLQEKVHQLNIPTPHVLAFLSAQIVAICKTIGVQKSTFKEITEKIYEEFANMED